MKTILENRWNCFLLRGLVIFNRIILLIMVPGCTKINEPVADGLSDLAEGFQYEKLMALI